MNLYESPSGHIVLLDIPSSISSPPGLALCSTSPPETPYNPPTPKATLPGTLDGLQCSLTEALEHVRKNYIGPYLRPRIVDMGDYIGELDFHANTSFLQPPSSLEFAALSPDVPMSDISDIFSVPISLQFDMWKTLTVSHPAPAKLFHIPPRASFLLSNVQSSVPAFLSVSDQLERFHFIVLDPPWPNKSALRSRSYSTFTRFEFKDLLLLPIDRALVAGRQGGIDPGGLVGIWITNKPSIRKFVLEELFPSWGLEEVGEWVWLKVTTNGEPVVGFGAQHRKPYESLLFGRRPVTRGGENISPSGKAGSDENEAARLPSKSILAVPDIHSRKPCIKGIYSSVLPPFSLA